jgi:hypothetical protein
VEELDLLHVGVDVVCPVLCEVVELLAVLINSVVLLTQVKELSQLAVHEAHREVVTTKRDTELTPWNMMINWQCGSVRCPLGPSWASELLSGIQSLLILCKVKQSEF